jgi:hypothetical protein
LVSYLEGYIYNSAKDYRGKKGILENMIAVIKSHAIGFVWEQLTDHHQQIYILI